MKKALKTPVIIALLALTACGGSEETEHATTSTETTQKTATAEKMENTEPPQATEKVDDPLPPNKPEGCDMDLNPYSPYGCDENGISIMPDNVPIHVRCAMLKGTECTNSEVNGYKAWWNQEGYDDYGNKNPSSGETQLEYACEQGTITDPALCG